MRYKLDIDAKMTAEAAYQDAAKQRSITISFQRLLKKSEITATAIARKSGQLSAEFKHNSIGIRDSLRLFFKSCLPSYSPTQLEFTSDDVRKNPAFKQYATVLLAQGYRVRIKEIKQAYQEPTLIPKYPRETECHISRPWAFFDLPPIPKYPVVSLQIVPLTEPGRTGTSGDGENMPLSESNVSSAPALRRA